MPLSVAYIMAAWHQDISISQDELEVLKFNVSESGTANLGESTFLFQPLSQPYSVAHAQAYFPISALNVCYLFNQWMYSSEKRA